MDSINRIDYKIRDISTHCVTLFPSRAQIQRNINNVSLKPGINEITIHGLSPTVDKDSIKVEGGPALTISDVSIEALPNRDIFEEIYPESDSDDAEEEKDGDDGDELDEMRWKESADLKDAKRELTALEDARRLADESVASAKSRLQLLDAYGKTLDRKRGVVIEESLETYKQQRSRAYEDYMSGLKLQRDAEDKIENQTSEVRRLQKMDDKVRAKAERKREKVQKAKEKDLFKKARREEERNKEKERIRKEREKFWPKYCYAVKITLETQTGTPLGSRRASFTGEAHVARPAADYVGPPKAEDKDEDEDTDAMTTLCDLILSYVTSAAYWVPSYDLQLSTTSATGTLSFDAELHNSTSETWTNSKVVLSTSQATFSGLDDSTPTLKPWYLRLSHDPPAHGPGEPHEQIARSNEELSKMRGYLTRQKMLGPQTHRASMFGIPLADPYTFDAEERMGVRRRQQYYPSPPPPAAAAAVATAGGGVVAADGAAAPLLMDRSREEAERGLKGFVPPSSLHENVEPRIRGALPSNMHQMQSMRPQMQSMEPQMQSMGPQMQSMGPQMQSMRPQMQSMRPQMQSMRPQMQQAVMDRDEAQYYEIREAAGSSDDFLTDNSEDDDDLAIMEETGLTTTYELPGAKTLVPKSTATKHRVAHIRFANVMYSYTVVAKYKPVAHLRAKFKNTSKMTLFRGQTGLSLDGSFMGRTSLPRCSAGDTFVLSLGVDPSIRVTYSKPAIQRSSPGRFSKEHTAVYTRSVTLHNTRASAGKPTPILVHDQVPVSENENLRVEILSPLGLSPGGGEVRTGTPVVETREHKDWGSAKASLRKEGEVIWEVSLNAGKAVRLTLEYGVAFPIGTYVSTC